MTINGNDGLMFDVEQLTAAAIRDVHGGDKAGHWIVGGVPMRAV